MSLEKFTFWGICQFDPTILDAITLPAPLDREILIDEIMKRSGSLFVYHQQPEYLKRSISNWFKRNEFNFKKQIEALQAEFNPIENYDRYEDLTETPDIEITNSTEYKNKANSSGENKVSAFNSSDYEPNNFNTSTADNNGDSSSTQKETGTRKHYNHIHGNIGTTQASDMIQNALDLYSFDLYTNIAERFEKEFLVQIY